MMGSSDDLWCRLIGHGVTMCLTLRFFESDVSDPRVRGWRKGYWVAGCGHWLRGCPSPSSMRGMAAPRVRVSVSWGGGVHGCADGFERAVVRFAQGPSTALAGESYAVDPWDTGACTGTCTGTWGDPR